MEDRLSWQYDEFKQVGTDYSEAAEVEIYDLSHARFRDIEDENNVILDTLGIGKNDVLLDFGAGTGSLAVKAALLGARVYAIDVSQAMLDYAKTRSVKSGVSNIVFCHGGFLTYDHQGPAADFIVTTFAFHHLPDFWKGIALNRMHRMLKPGGQLYIHDVILEEQHPIEDIAALIEKLAAAGGNLLREDTERHFREEYSTYDWVMEGLLQRSGFAIKSKKIQDGAMGTYLCAKTKEVQDRE